MKKKNITLSFEDIAWGVGGAIIGIGSNFAISKAIANQGEDTKKMVGNVLPFAKVGGGAVLATRKKTPRNWKLFGAGLAAEGGIEVAIRFAPNQFQIAGTDVFSMIGNSTLEQLPIAPGAQMEDDGFIEEDILGTKVEEEVIL